MSTPLFKDKVAEIFVNVDDFCVHFEDEFKKHTLPPATGTKTRKRKTNLTHSEVISILIAFHNGQFRNFKHFYCNYVCLHLRDCFPDVVSYNRFIELSHRCAVPFMLFLHYCCRGECTGISFIDSTVLRVCHNKRIKRNKVFKTMAKVGKSTIGWFFGFKLHLIINDKGEILSFYLSQGNTSDNNARIITRMTKEIFGKVFGDKGYINKALADLLFDDGIQLITAVRRNMKQRALSNEEKLLLRKRSVIETVNDELKNICQVEHTRHRSVAGFILNILGAIAAYSFFPKKPSIKEDIEETNPILIQRHNQPKLIAA
ncbi:MAG: IS982 family transposase [Chitinophagaceae bacterium]|nr:IS982 family transposase [Chitinophagaceae bacterium]